MSREPERGCQSAYPHPDASAKVSYECGHGRHSCCAKLTCPCACHKDEAV